MFTYRQPSYHLKKRISENNEKSISVFKTRKKYELRFIAVKIYNKRRHKDYNKEYEILKEIDCPSIVKVFGCSEDRNNFYMEMEYCLITLFEICNRNQQNKFYEKVIKYISTQILLGLKALHNKGYIHCNLKPKNILVDELGKIKICDFRKVLNEKEMTIEEIRKNKSVITPCYTAPEIMSQNGMYSFKSDLYSLGCIMYELATGVVPFYDNDINTLVKKIMNSNYDKRPLLVYSIDFSNIVNALLEKDPNKRPGWGEIEKFPFWDLEDTNNNSNNKFNINHILNHNTSDSDISPRQNNSSFSYKRPNSSSIILNHNNTKEKEYVLVFVNRNNNKTYTSTISSWEESTPYDLGSENGNSYTDSWFKGEIDFSNIPNGDYDIYLLAKTNDYYTIQLVNNFLNRNISRRGEDNNHGYNFKVQQRTKTKELQLSVREELYTASEAPTSRNMVNGYDEIKFTDNKLYIFGYSYDYEGEYKDQFAITRKIIFENNSSYEQKDYNVGSIKGPFELQTLDNKDKTYAWFETSLDITSLSKGTYTLLIYTKTNNAENYDEMPDMLKRLNETQTINGKKYTIYCNRNKNNRIELKVE